MLCFQSYAFQHHPRRDVRPYVRAGIRDFSEPRRVSTKEFTPTSLGVAAKPYVMQVEQNLPFLQAPDRKGDEKMWFRRNPEHSWSEQYRETGLRRCASLGSTGSFSSWGSARMGSTRMIESTCSDKMKGIAGFAAVDWERGCVPKYDAGADLTIDERIAARTAELQRFRSKAR